MNTRSLIFVVLLLVAVGAAWWSIRPTSTDVGGSPGAPAATARGPRAPTARPAPRAPARSEPARPGQAPSPDARPASVVGAAEGTVVAQVEDAVVGLSQARDALFRCDLSAHSDAEQTRLVEVNERLAHEADALLALGPDVHAARLPELQRHIEAMEAQREAAGCP